MIKIAITDDHPMVIDGLKNALCNNPEIDITGIYTNGQELLDGLYMIRPDVLLLDMNLPDKTGSELVPIIIKKYPEIKILILSGMEAASFVKTMMQYGCMGYLLKANTNQQMLLQAIRSVYDDELFIDPMLKEELMYGIVKAKKKLKDNTSRLTYREKEVLKLIAAEMSNQEIAQKLFISQRTVEKHRYNLQQKLDAKNTASLVKIALQMGII